MLTNRYDADGGTSVEDQTVEEGKAVTKPADPTKEGYTFDGWYSDPDCTNVYDFAAQVTEDITLYAKWMETSTKEPSDPGTEDPSNPIVTKYVISYDLNGGMLDGKTGIITIQAEKGSTITIPEAPTREGYIFTYWKGSEYHPGDSYKVEGDHTFTAQWEKKESASDDGTLDDDNTDDASDSKIKDDGKKAGFSEKGTDTSKSVSAKSDMKKNSDAKATVPSTGVLSPKTGDESHMILWCSLMIAALFGVFMTFFQRKRFRKER